MAFNPYPRLVQAILQKEDWPEYEVHPVPPWYQTFFPGYRPRRERMLFKPSKRIRSLALPERIVRIDYDEQQRLATEMIEGLEGRFGELQGYPVPPKQNLVFLMSFDWKTAVYLLRMHVICPVMDVLNVAMKIINGRQFWVIQDHMSGFTRPFRPNFQIIEAFKREEDDDGEDDEDDDDYDEEDDDDEDDDSEDDDEDNDEDERFQNWEERDCIIKNFKTSSPGSKLPTAMAYLVKYRIRYLAMMGLPELTIGNTNCQITMECPDMAHESTVAGRLAAGTGVLRIATSEKRGDFCLSFIGSLLKCFKHFRKWDS
ncbi:hypothetical protein CMEL01_15143 [Colletotrichum melonis]|uniref:Uncharacterized protein n=1 Tax=Colletotrichum melonis TaxID=1209925 RepID=A0AAI9XRZ0_9PEZI|nr:hypothetical protein CMEL01_15143 [Colletotrichum melonis]